MKMIKLKPANLLYNIAVLMILLTLFTAFTPVEALAVSAFSGTAIGIGLGFMPKYASPVLFMAAQREIWQSHLIGNYWADNAFAKTATQVDKANIYGGKFVHQPVLNGRPTVTKNLNSFPATPGTVNYGDIYYMIDEFYVAPFRIPNAEKYELTFDSRQSVVGEQSSAANKVAADWLLRNWFSYTQTEKDGTSTTIGAQKMATTGLTTYSNGSTAQVTTGAHVGSGLRYATRVADFSAVKVKFNLADVPLLNRSCALDSNMLDQVTQDPEYKRAWQVYEKELIEGTVARIQGFDIYERSSVLKTVADGSALTAYGSVDANDANAAALFWHTYGVESAVGDAFFFENENRAEWYGDIVSALLRASGRIRRADSVVALYQGKPSS